MEAAGVPLAGAANTLALIAVADAARAAGLGGEAAAVVGESRAHQIQGAAADQPSAGLQAGAGRGGAGIQAKRLKQEAARTQPAPTAPL